MNTDDNNFMHMQLPSPTPHKDRNTEVCMWGDVVVIITRIQFDVVRFSGFLFLGV